MPRVYRPRSAAPVFTPAASLLTAAALLAGASGCSEDEVFEPLADYEPSGALPFGATSVASAATRDVVVQSRGSAPVKISNATIDGPDADKFTVVLPAELESLAPGQTSSVTVTYKPCPQVWNGNVVPEDADLTQCPGVPATATLVLTDNTSEGSVSITLSGSPVQPPNISFRCSAVCNDASAARSGCTTLNYGLVDGSGEPCDLYLEIVNENREGANGASIPVAPATIEGAEALVVDNGANGGPEIIDGAEIGFSFLDESGAPLAFPMSIPVPTGQSSGSELIRVRFTGERAGVYIGAPANGTGARFFTNDGEERTKTVAISALASTPDIFCRPGRIDFGSVTQGETATATVTCSNQGDLPLEVSSIGIESGNAEFEIEAETPPLTPRTLQGGGGDRVRFFVSYTPSSPESDSERLVVQSTDPDEGNLVINVTGGPTPVLCQPQSLDFEPTTASQESTSTMALESCGTGNLHITQLDLTTMIDGSLDDFSIEGCSSFPCAVDIWLCPADDPGCTINGQTPGTSWSADVTYKNNDISSVDYATILVGSNDPERQNQAGNDARARVNLEARDNPCQAPNVFIEVVTTSPCVPDPVELRIGGTPGGPVGENATLVECSYNMLFGSTQVFSPNESAEACNGSVFIPRDGGIHRIQATVTNSCGASASSPSLIVAVAPSCE